MVRILFSLAEGKNIDHTKAVAHRNSETADENARFGIILALSHKVGHKNSLWSNNSVPKCGPRRSADYVYQDRHSRLFTAALFIIAKDRNNSILIKVSAVITTSEVSGAW